MLIFLRASNRILRVQPWWRRLFPTSCPFHQNRGRSVAILQLYFVCLGRYRRWSRYSVALVYQTGRVRRHAARQQEIGM